MSGKKYFCEITLWWNSRVFKDSQISKHFFCYPIELMEKEGFDTVIMTRQNAGSDERNYDSLARFPIVRLSDNNIVYCASLFFRILTCNFSLIHLHTVGYAGDFSIMMAARIRGVPVVFSNHDHDFFNHYSRPGNKIPWKINLMKRLLQISGHSNNAFIAFTRWQYDLLNDWGISNVVQIPHGINPDAFNVPLSDSILKKLKVQGKGIICVGTICQRKGQDILVEAMPDILRSVPDAFLYLVGRPLTDNDRVYKRSIEDRARLLNVIDRVIFIENASKDELVQLYKASKVFALPTETEMFGIVYIEAMLTGLPVVTTDKPLTREVLSDGKAGILVDRNPDAFSQAIVTVFNDSDLRERLKNNGILVVRENYHIDMIKDRLTYLYRSLMDKRSHS